MWSPSQIGEVIGRLIAVPGVCGIGVILEECSAHRATMHLWFSEPGSDPEVVVLSDVPPPTGPGGRE